MILDENSASFRFKIDRSMQEKLELQGVYFSLMPKTYRFRDGEIITCVKGAVIEPFVVLATHSLIEVGFASYVSSRFEPGFSIGRYCSIAENVRIMGPSHPTDRISTNSFTYGDWSNIHINPRLSLGGGPIEIAGVRQKLLPTVRHDVWIGQDVLLARGIELGIGCVVAAGSVVTKDVQPYAIVGGNPAKLIRYRFGEDVVEQLLQSGWWDYAFPSFHKFSVHDPLRFLEQLSAAKVDKEISPYSPAKVDVMSLLFPSNP